MTEASFDGQWEGGLQLLRLMRGQRNPGPGRGSWCVTPQGEPAEADFPFPQRRNLGGNLLGFWLFGGGSVGNSRPGSSPAPRSHCDDLLPPSKALGQNKLSAEQRSSAGTILTQRGGAGTQDPPACPLRLPAPRGALGSQNTREQVPPPIQRSQGPGWEAQVGASLLSEETDSQEILSGGPPVLLCLGVSGQWGSAPGKVAVDSV